MKRYCWKNFIKMLLSLVLLLSVLWNSITPVCAKERPTEPEDLLEMFYGDGDWYYFYAEMRFQHLIRQGEKSIYGNAYDMNLKKGDTYDLKFYTAKDFFVSRDKLPEPYTDFVLRSSKKDIVSVDKNGRLIAKKNGVATITIDFLIGDRDEVGYTRKIKVNVTADKILGAPSTIDLSKKEVFKLSLSGKNAVKSWKSSDTKVAQVDREGNLVGTGFGTAVISCTDTKGRIYSTLVTASCESLHDWSLINVLPKTSCMTYTQNNKSYIIYPNDFSPNCFFTSGFLREDPDERDAKACYYGGEGDLSTGRTHHNIYTYKCVNCGLNLYDYDDNIITEDEGRAILKTYAESELFGNGTYGLGGENGQALFMSGLLFGDLPATVHTDFTNLHVGDVIYYYGKHYAVVYDVSEDRTTYSVCGGGLEHGERYWNKEGSTVNRSLHVRNAWIYTRYGSEIEPEYILTDQIDIYNITALPRYEVEFDISNHPFRYYYYKDKIRYRTT